MTGSVVDLPEDDLTRKVTFWDSCEEDGTLLDREVAVSISEVSSVENQLPHPGDTAIRDICSLTKETRDEVDLEAILTGIQGDESVAAVKVYGGNKDIDGNPKW